MNSIPHEPNIIAHQKTEVYSNLAKVVGDACEAWLRKKGMGTHSFRETISQGHTEAKAKKNK